MDTPLYHDVTALRSSSGGNDNFPYTFGMTEIPSGNGSGNSASPEPPQLALPPQPSALRKIFIGPNGLRAGWRLLIYFGLIFAFVSAYRFVRHLIQPGTRPRPDLLNPGPQLYSHGLAFLLAAIPALIMTRIEGTHWRDYGLPFRKAFGKNFWLGVLWGIVALSIIMLALWLGHYYVIDGLALHGPEILKYAALWAGVMLLVGLVEEFSLRGYPQYTLASGIGFWPAALFLSFVFLLGHVGNGGEDWLGLIDVFLFGMFACFTLWRTGDIWFAVGVHFAWDWGLTFLYSGPNSGMLATGQLLKVRFSGPAWLSGGSAGPEGSVINIVFDLMWFPLFALLYRHRQWIGMNERREAGESTSAVVIDSSALSG